MGVVLTDVYASASINSVRIADSDILHVLHRKLFYDQLGFTAHNVCLFLIPQRNVDLRWLFAEKGRKSSPNV